MIKLNYTSKDRAAAVARRVRFFSRHRGVVEAPRLARLTRRHIRHIRTAAPHFSTAYMSRADSADLHADDGKLLQDRRALASEGEGGKIPSHAHNLVMMPPDTP